MMRLAAIALLATCAPSGKPIAPATSGIDWSVPPAPRPAARFVPPAVERFALRNGIGVLLVENHRLPIVTIVAVNAGAGSRQGKPGLAALTAALLDQGAGTRDAEAFADELDRLGATLDVDIASDHASVSMSALGDHLPQTIGLLAEALRHPHFDPGDVARIRRERVAELELHLDQPRIVAAQLFDRIEFGDQHPYGHPAEGDWRAVDALEQPDVRAFWSRAYGPTTTKLIVAGGVSREVLEHELDRAFGDWTNPPPPAVPRAPPAAAPQLAYVDRPGADEVAIVIGRRVDPPTGPAADRAQRLAGDLENAVMGGAAARFPLRFAELGYGGAIGSSFWRGELGGTWSVAATVKRREAAAATREMLRMIATARTVDASAAELAHARTQLVRGTPLGFETNWGVAHALQRLVVGGLPMDHYATYADGLADITPAVARGAAAAWTDLTVVVVGDWAQIAHDFDRLGLPVVRYDVR